MTAPALYIDTHCHLYDQRSKDGTVGVTVDEIITAARAAGVTGMISVGCDAASTQQAIEVAAQYDGPDLPAKIRAFLQEAYAQWGIRDLLIVGTFDLIPARKLYISVTDILSTVTAEIPSDAIYYGCLDGPFDGNGNGRYGEITDGLNGKDVDLIAEIMVEKVQHEIR